MQEFFVDNFRVDLLRNQIVREGKAVALEPKVLEVLLVLAETPGEVISHQILHDKVWPDTVVAPNALQRCIGQLRKAFNDDGKRQQVIVTHPKKGYSLVAPVSVRTKEVFRDEQSESLKSTPPNITTSWFNSSSKNTWLSGTALIVVVLVVLFLQFKKNQLVDLSQYDQLSPLTATDLSEFYSVYSPDGKSVVFSRNESGVGGHFWLKDLTTNREFQLTKKSGQYGQPNWSEDGRKIAFFDLAGCLKQGASQCGQNSCYDINTVFVPMALSEPQMPKVELSCIISSPQGLQWTSDKDIAFIRHQDQKSEIIELDTQTSSQTVVHSFTRHMPYNLSYSFVNKTLAVMQQSPELEQSLLFISIKMRVHNQIIFPYPEKYGSWVRWYPVWNADGNGLIFSAANKLYHMDLEGQVTSNTIPTFLDISRPMLHPNNASIAMTLGKVDRDIAKLTLNVDKNLPLLMPFARSILRESDAQFEPRGGGVAFISERSGARQLWYLANSNDSQPTQLTRVKTNQYLEAFVWSANGKHIAALTENQILLVNKEGRVETLPLNIRVINLYQWKEDGNLLLSAVDEEGVKLVSLNLHSGKYKTHYLGYVKWAQQLGSSPDSIVFTGLENKVMRLNNGKAMVYEPLKAISARSRYFVRGGELFLLTSSNDILRLALTDRKLAKLFHYQDSSVELTDVKNNGESFLVSHFVSAKKEVVLLERSKE